MNHGLIESAQCLVDILAQENDALKRLDFSSATAMIPLKEAALADLAKQPRMRIVPPPVAAIGKLLGALATENQALLERAIAVQMRIVRIVARAYTPAPAMTQYKAPNGRASSTQRTALALSTRA